MRNLTPQSMRCTFGPACPGVYQLDDGRLLIVGKSAEYLSRKSTCSDATDEDIAVEKAYRSLCFSNCPGNDEHVIVIHPDLLVDYVKQAKEKADG